MTLAPSPPVPSAASTYGIRTVLADGVRATIQVSQDLDSAGVAALERVVDEHCVAGRRFLRISIAGVGRLDAKFVALLERTHYRLLARRGTSIVTGVGKEVMARLRKLDLDRVLLLVETCADD